ncbi:MAG: site-specific DNA-methyltransferase [Ignavibacteria bacterium]|nr:site-specific DNA-methyltransferase [Ignavibacteria bacterium]
MSNFIKYIENFNLQDNSLFFDNDKYSTRIENFKYNGFSIPKYINEFWTSKQRQANSLHEVSYRACFKPQLPRFFIEGLTEEKDTVYDPFSGRGTSALEASLLNRKAIANDINPLSLILLKPRLNPPTISEINKRLNEIIFSYNLTSDIDLSMFYDENTLSELVSLKNYLIEKKDNNTEDEVDDWIRMVATNRLTGHSKGFFSVFTLPPNQAVSQKSQIRINEKRQQTPDYRNIKKLILGKSKQLLSGINTNTRKMLSENYNSSLLLNLDARDTPQIKDNSISLTVTSPPFLDLVQYANDNWLRLWFNNLNADEIARNIVMAKTEEQWHNFIFDVFKELFRITKPNAYIAFEVGDLKNGKVKLDEIVVSIGIEVGLKCLGIIINEQVFTKTSNIWGVKNNHKGTNTNRIVIFQKGS